MKAVLVKPGTCVMLAILLGPHSDLWLRHWRYMDNLTASYVDTVGSDSEI